MWPFQKQPTNLQTQVAGPPPEAGMRTPIGGQMARNGLDAPFGVNDPLHGPGRASERIAQQQSGTPLNAYLAELVVDSVTPHYKHAHRMRAPIVRDFPRAPWKPNPRAAFLAPNAYTSLRQVVKAYAPIAPQWTRGGLVIAASNVPLQNLNTSLAVMYQGAAAPVSANQSSRCK